MRKCKPFVKPSVLYLLRITWEDDRGVTFDSPVYVGNDDKLTPSELERVTSLWLEYGIDQRAKEVLGFTVQQMLNT